MIVANPDNREERRGPVPTLRAVLGRLEEASIDGGELTVHTPDLTDVFLALTGGRGADPADYKVAVKEHSR